MLFYFFVFEVHSHKMLLIYFISYQFQSCCSYKKLILYKKVYNIYLFSITNIHIL